MFERNALLNSVTKQCQAQPRANGVRRVDLHCHSNASNEASEAVLNAINCPESFSHPQQVHQQAKSRGMDFVALTDHDSLDGVSQLNQPDVIIGEELTCFFPEDGCKMHVLVWGITPQDHADLQAVAHDIYQVAAMLHQRRLAHSVAHPVYRQNDLLERWHLERLILLFKGFETLNGAHSVLHRNSFEPMLDALTPQRIEQLATTHGIAPLWPQPHVKARTGGSDDHGLLNIGRTWTEFPADVQSIPEVLQALRTGRCQPGGESGSSLKLAHNFFGVAIRYYCRNLTHDPNSLHGAVLARLTGDSRRPGRLQLVKALAVSRAKSWGRRLVQPFSKTPPARGSQLLLDLFVQSCQRNLPKQKSLMEAMLSGNAVLGEHSAMFDFISTINRDITAGIADAVTASVNNKRLTGLFDTLSTVAAHQFVMFPYYFALFHQNRERADLRRITGHGAQFDAASLKVGVFTDTFDEVNGVCRFIRDMNEQACRRGRHMIVHTCTSSPVIEDPSRKNFVPLLSQPLPLYPGQPIAIPPLIEILEWADRQQFDAIHIHTPGPMGLCGLVVAKMLQVPVLGTYHTDFPQYVQDLSGDYRLHTIAHSFMQWLYGQCAVVLSRSRDYQAKLRAMNIPAGRLSMALPGVDTDKFSPDARDIHLWEKHRIAEPFKLFYAGRISLEKNLPFLAQAFKILCRRRSDVALVIAGEGPYEQKLRQELVGLPVHFTGVQTDSTLPTFYASSDLFVFPSKTDTLGQVVCEAQACGLPVLVSEHGGPREVMDDQVTGLVLNTTDPLVWADAIDQLLDDAPRRCRMSRTAPNRVARFSLANSFDGFWNDHLRAVQQAADQCEKRSPRAETTAANAALEPITH